jgi:hypothetical protein
MGSSNLNDVDFQVKEIDLISSDARSTPAHQTTHTTDKCFVGHAAEFGRAGGSLDRPLPAHYPRGPSRAGARPCYRRDARLTIERHQRTDRRRRCPDQCLAQGEPGSQRLTTIPRIGTLIGTAIAATVADRRGLSAFREFATWVGPSLGLDDQGRKLPADHLGTDRRHQSAETCKRKTARGRLFCRLFPDQTTASGRSRSPGPSRTSMLPHPTSLAYLRARWNHDPLAPRYYRIAAFSDHGSDNKSRTRSA